MPSTAARTEEYVRRHAYVRACLKKDIINYSKLARSIAKLWGVEKKTTIEAIIVALRRYRQDKAMATDDDQVIRILKDSELEIKTRIAAVIIDKPRHLERLAEIEEVAYKERDQFYAVEGSRTVTVVTLDKYVARIRKAFPSDVIRVHDRLVLLLLKSSKAIESTPGVIASIYSLLADRGINIVETMSCWTDSIIIIEEKDLGPALECLRWQ